MNASKPSNTEAISPPVPVGDPRSQRTTVVHPLTGEILEALETLPPERLADALHAIQARQRAHKQMQVALEDELLRRLDIRGRKHATFGDWELSVDITREADWDVEETERVLGELIEEGVLRPGEVSDWVSRKPVPSKSAMQRITRRLAPGYADRLTACREWIPKGRRRVRVTRSVNLLAQPSPSEENS